MSKNNNTLLHKLHKIYYTIKARWGEFGSWPGAVWFCPDVVPMQRSFSLTTALVPGPCNLQWYNTPLHSQHLSASFTAEWILLLANYWLLLATGEHRTASPCTAQMLFFFSPFFVIQIEMKAAWHFMEPEWDINWRDNQSAGCGARRRWWAIFPPLPELYDRLNAPSKMSLWHRPLICLSSINQPSGTTCQKQDKGNIKHV